MIPSDGSLAEPRPAEFEAFYRTLTVGDERGVSAITAAGLHFFPLFVTLPFSFPNSCLLERRWVRSVHQTLLFYSGHWRVTTLIAWERLWLITCILINPRVKYMVGFLLLVWRPTSMLGYALMITL